MDKSREYDLQQLRKDYKTADRYQRKLIEKAADNIRKESGLVKSMRERLIKEARNNRKDNIRDIHEYIAEKLRYR